MSASGARLTVPAGYDPLMLHHWLWWQYLSLTATADGFQQLFENIMVRAKPGFQRIRPYGKIGDRKSDGWLATDGIIYQVYSPDEVKQAEVQAKIEGDLAGAVKHWKKLGMKRWVFVYNARRGLAPDIPATLAQQRTKYKKLDISHMSNDDLWEVVRGLPIQQRVEILGAPPSVEHLLLLPADISPDAAERLRQGRFVVIHDVMSPIDVPHILAAIHPDQPLGPPLRIRPDVRMLGWAAAAAEQRTLVDDAIAKSAQLRPRFAVFSFSPIPLLVHLGFLLSDRVEVALFQYDRVRKSWSWDADLGRTADMDIAVSGLPEEEIAGPVQAVIRVSLSGRVAPRDTEAAVPGAGVVVDIGVADPGVMWLRSPDQLTALGTVFRQVLQRLAERVPDCAGIHLFYAGPTGGAIVIGQAYNPRMNPPMALYEYDRQGEPRNVHVLTLTSPS